MRRQSVRRTTTPRMRTASVGVSNDASSIHTPGEPLVSDKPCTRHSRAWYATFASVSSGRAPSFALATPLLADACSCAPRRSHAMPCSGRGRSPRIMRARASKHVHRLPRAVTDSVSGRAAARAHADTSPLSLVRRLAMVVALAAAIVGPTRSNRSTHNRCAAPCAPRGCLDAMERDNSASIHISLSTATAVRWAAEAAPLPSARTAPGMFGTPPLC